MWPANVVYKIAVQKLVHLAMQIRDVLFVRRNYREVQHACGIVVEPYHAHPHTDTHLLMKNALVVVFFWVSDRNLRRGRRGTCHRYFRIRTRECYGVGHGQQRFRHGYSREFSST